MLCFDGIANLDSSEPFPKKRLAKSQEAKSQGQDRCKGRLESADSGLMPRRGHSSERRAGSDQLDSESSSESDSEAGQRPPAGLGMRRAPPRPPIVRRAPAQVAVDPRVCCPGCGRVFASLDILKKHRNAPRLANAACRAAARANKRPRSVPRAAGEADGDGPGDAGDQIARMMGDGDQSVAPWVAPDPSPSPRTSPRAG